MRPPSLFALFAVIVTSIIPLPARGQSYTVTDLGTLSGGTYSLAWGMNARGEVTGIADTSTGAIHAFLFSNGSMQDLGTLPGGRNSGGSGINASGQVTGWSETSVPDQFHAFVFSGGVMQDLGTLPGDITSAANAINDAGQVTGHSSDAAGVSHAILYSKGVMSSLGTLPGFSSSIGLGINNYGVVAGVAESPWGFTRAVVFGGGAVADLGSLPNSAQASARAINDLGQVTGLADSYNDVTYHAFLYNQGVMEDLGMPPNGLYSAGQSINKIGQVTGEFGFPTGGAVVAHAFVVSFGSIMQDLNDLIPPNSGWTLETGYGINDAGQIVGRGTLNGAVRGFLLTPVVPDTTPPHITLSASPRVLWPPNDKPVSVTVWGRITDDGSGVAAGSAVYVVMDEYQEVQPNARMTLDTNGDFAFRIQLRASRRGNDLDGRQYVISVGAKDNAGNARTESLTVTVPHDRR